MKYIPKEQLATYLKLKKQLALFIGTGQYFENRTFDWIKLDYYPDTIVCTKVRSLDEGNEIFSDILSFATVNDLEKEIGLQEEERYSGTLEQCLVWINDNYRVDTNTFILMEELPKIYLALVEKGELEG